MQNIKNSDQYFRLIEQSLNELGIQRYPKLRSYFLSIRRDFYECEKRANPVEPFFSTLSKVLHLDSKLVLLGDSIKWIDYFGLNQEEIIQQIEKDSQTFNKELCGYKVDEKPHLSLLFNAYDHTVDHRIKQ